MEDFIQQSKQFTSSFFDSVKKLPSNLKFCGVCTAPCLFYGFETKYKIELNGVSKEMRVCRRCHVAGKVVEGTKYEDYIEYGSPYSIHCGLCDAICNSHYYRSTQGAIEIQTGNTLTKELRLLCPLCYERTNTPSQNLPENFQEEKLLWPSVVSGTLSDFKENGTYKTTAPKVIMSFGSAGGMYEKMHEMVNFVRNALGWEQGDIWIDREQIWRHPDWQEKYKNTLREAPVIVFMISMAWLKSEYCLQELKWWQELPKENKPLAIMGILESEVFSQPEFGTLVKIVLHNITFQDVMSFRTDRILDLSLPGGRHQLALTLELLFPDTDKFLEQGKWAARASIHGAVKVGKQATDLAKTGISTATVSAKKWISMFSSEDKEDKEDKKKDIQSDN